MICVGLGWSILSAAAALPAAAAPQAVGPSAALPCPPVITCDPAGALAGHAANDAARAALDATVGWVADGAKALLDRIGALIGDTTDVEVIPPWTADRVAAMQRLAVVIALPLLLAALISAVIHQDPGRLIRAVGVYLPLAVLSMFVAVQLTNIGLAVTDELCKQFSADAGQHTAQAFQNMGKAMTSLYSPVTPGTGGFVAFLAAIVVVIGALVIWLEMLLRSTAIYVAVMFLPLTLSGLVWPATARCAKRLIEILVALILSKFVVVAVIDLAVNGLAASNAPTDGISAGLSGAAMLLLAAFAPFALLRLVPLVEAGVIGHLEGMSRRPVGAAMTSSQSVQRMVATAGSAGAGAGAAAAAEIAEGPARALIAEPARGLPGFLDGLGSGTGQSSADRPPPDVRQPGADRFPPQGRGPDRSDGARNEAGANTPRLPVPAGADDEGGPGHAG